MRPFYTRWGPFPLFCWCPRQFFKDASYILDKYGQEPYWLIIVDRLFTQT